MKSINKLITVLLFTPIVTMSGQNVVMHQPTDSMNLSSVLNEVIKNYPSILKAEKELDASDAKIGLANSAYFPDINITSSYAHLGPVSSITIPNMGTFQLFPGDNYSAALNINQSIYDFGKTAKNIAFEKQSKDMTKLAVEQIKQGLSQRVVGVYYPIVFLQDAIKIKDDELATLNEHLRYVQKKAETGSATQYEILTTKVRISSIENQKTDIQTSLQVLQSQMNSLIGKPQDNKVLLKKDLNVSEIILPADSLFAYAFEHRDEMKMARQKTEMAKTRYQMVSTQNNPALNFFANGGLKNGYLPDLSALTPNYTVGVGLKIPIYDANRTKYSKLQVKANMEGNDQDTELAKRNIVNEVVESRANALAALKKVSQSELQLQQSQDAYSLAETNFEAGAITNLDLLESYTAVAETKLVLLKTKIDYTVSLLKLKIAVGEQIY
ncbi:MAG: TolC family protein [Paludibacter sp.]|nr:TolC family protein [Paludibacter sp.]